MPTINFIYNKIITSSRRFCRILTTTNISTSKMSISISALTPDGVRSMRVLDREKFLLNLTVPVFTVTDDKISKVTKTLKAYFLKLENFKPVQDCQDMDSPNDTIKRKKIFCHPEKITRWLDISESDRTALNQENVTEDHLLFQNIQLKYENFKIDTIFKAVLPENEDIVSSFSQIGHIIHLNLRDHLLEYRQLIGQVLLDKIKTCRTVVNKSNIIDNTYRNFKMEVIAGDEDFLVTVKENRCNFQFDFSKVYWNPRLCKEHERILGFLKPGHVLFDVFCGVGPFAVPAAKRKCLVYANDLNPDSYKWLQHNAKQNKCPTSLLNMYNQDGKDFICNIFKSYIIKLCEGAERLDSDAKIHVTMNLPALAVEFLKHFNGLIEEEYYEKISHEIRVYVYCFAIGEKPNEVAKEMVLQNIGMDISNQIIDVFNVRNVSPKKEMMRVTFLLTKDVLCKKTLQNDEPPVKKLCV